MDEPVTLDFETKRIESRPHYPPKPVGLAIRWPGGRSEYLAFGHPEGNNCDVGKAHVVLHDVYRSGKPVLFHNGSFDLDVADTYFAEPVPANVEDSLFIAFLKNPHEQTISLKPLGEKYLDMPPEEQEDLRDYILANVKQENGKKITKKKEWGAYISEAPVSLVAPYAIGDVERTFKFWDKFRPEIVRRGMYDAYRREIDLIPITLEMERSGVRVDMPGLKRAHMIFSRLDNQMIRAIYKKLNISGDTTSFNIDSPTQLAQALIRADKLSARVLTPTGKQSTKVSVLHETCNDRELLDLLQVRSVVKKLLTGFISSWIEQAEITDGRVLPKFNQVRAKTGEGGGGTRSGRYSSADPNLQTVTANVDESKNKDVLQLLQKWLLEFYQYPFIGLRDFFLPDEGTILTSIDFNQQELRLLAHFEQGLLCKAYNENPELDIHEFFRQMIFKTTGTLFERKAVKILVFGQIYGMGVGKLAVSINQPVHVAAKMRDGLFAAVPGIKTLMKELIRLADNNLPLRTFGGRQYYCEPPYTMPDGKIINFSYKLLNYLVQGSAADVTKQAMLNVVKEVPQARIAVQVHDELICMIPHKKYGNRIAKAMCMGTFNVPMTAEAKYSEKSWARVEKL
jgi:DNA polymerase-1